MKGESSKLLLAGAIIIAVIGIGAAAYALSRPDGNTTTETAKTATSETDTSTTEEATDSTDADNTAVIVFTDDGFSQSTYTFPAGQKITVENKSSMDMQFSSDDHPSHRDHTELNLPVLGAGENASFTPSGKGTYGFHDHINDQFEGTLVIE